MNAIKHNKVISTEHGNSLRDYPSSKVCHLYCHSPIHLRLIWLWDGFKIISNNMEIGCLIQMMCICQFSVRSKSFFSQDINFWKVRFLWNNDWGIISVAWQKWLAFFQYILSSLDWSIPTFENSWCFSIRYFTLFIWFTFLGKCDICCSFVQRTNDAKTAKEKKKIGKEKKKHLAGVKEVC